MERRIVSFLMALVMLLSLLPGAAFAAEQAESGSTLINAQVLLLYLGTDNQYAENYIETKVSADSTYQDLYDLLQFPAEDAHSAALGDLTGWKMYYDGESLSDTVVTDSYSDEPTTHLSVYAVYEYDKFIYTAHYADEQGAMLSHDEDTLLPVGTTQSQFLSEQVTLPDCGYDFSHWHILGEGDAYYNHSDAYACYDGLMPLCIVVNYEGEDGETIDTHYIYVKGTPDTFVEEDVKNTIIQAVQSLDGLCPEGKKISGYAWDYVDLTHSVEEYDGIGECCTGLGAMLTVEYETDSAVAWPGYTPISTPAELHAIRNNLSGNYYLVNDIEFTDADFAEGGAFYNSGRGWTPIGGFSSPKSFTGVLDGNGYSIKNLTINYRSTGTIYAGLFANNKGTICNLGMENCDIFVSHDADVFAYVGGLVGYNYGRISNCYVTGRIYAEGANGSSFAGGMAGYNYNGIIKESYNMASVDATYAAGGIAATGGLGDESIIENCFNTGKITTTKNEDTSSTFAFSGGIIGTADGTISCCYNVGPIISSSVAGYITALASGSVISNCYYLDGIIVGDIYACDGVTKCTLDHMKRETTFGGFDFNGVWTMAGDGDYLYPELVNTPMDFTKEIHGITLSSLPYKTEYYTGLEPFDVTGGKIAVVYNDGTYDEVALEEDMVSGFDNAQVGMQTLTVTYNSASLYFDIEVLALVYDYKITTDESITLELTAKKNFEFVLSDETVAKITSVQSSTIQWGSTIQKTSAATIVPLKPGFVVVRAVDDAGNILSKTLLLVEEGEHQLQLSEVLTVATCTESGKELHTCKFCGYQEEVTKPAAGHKEVTIPGKAATCTDSGISDGKKCSVCGVVTVAQKTIAAKGHSYANGTCTVCGAKDPNYVAGLTGVTRIFGADRYETAFKTAEVLKQQLGVDKFDNIVVACGDNFADALGGSYLAAKKNAPILLVKSSKIDAVKSYIKANLNPGGTVYLLGGTAAIPAAMDTGLDGFTVRRLAGATRYDTNLLILEEAGVTNEDILICTGKSFADSLSAAAAGRPLLLVKDSLNDSQKAFLQSHAANKKYILGGTAAVSTSVENQAKAYGTVKRIGGNTRYETSVLIAQEFFPDATQAALAYAQNFPDGLSGGALAYAMKAPLVLTASGKESVAAAYAKEQGITSGVILGGSGLISDKAVRTIFQMQSGDVIKLG